MSLKKEIREEITRLIDTPGKTLLNLILSREDFRLLAEEISKHEGGFEDVTIMIDDIKVSSSDSMPFRGSKRIEYVTLDRAFMYHSKRKEEKEDDKS